MAYQPMHTVDGSDHVKIQLNIQGKPHDAVFHKNRFERIMDKVDTHIHRNKSADDIKRKFKDHLISLTPTKAKSVARVKKVGSEMNSGPFDKKAHVAKHVKPGMTVGQIAKAASEGGKLTYANAHYLAKKHLESVGK